MKTNMPLETLTAKQAIEQGLTGLQFLEHFPDASYREACDLSLLYSEAALDALARKSAHRCSPDMPPCPQCEQIQNDEDYQEFGL